MSWPLPDFLHALLGDRKREGPYVFPGTHGGPLVEIRRHMARVTEQSGVSFTIHDLRRTFASAAEALVTYPQLKRLLNHSLNDVTAGYIVLSVEALRDPMQRIAHKLFQLCRGPGEVVPITAGKAKAE